MFKQEDFELPMETQLKLRVMSDEIESCRDVEALRKNLKNTATLLVKYQHILNRVMERVMEQEIAKLLLMPEETNNVK